MQKRALPGITFHIENPNVVELPRMDVAGFVGFADRGPLHLPVMVEDVPHFEDIFGGIYPLAWDDELALTQTACLAPAVRAFFAQGGRRCWVVRVADAGAVTNRFPLAGVLQPDVQGYQAVTATARSAGSWSDGLQVTPELLLDALTFRALAVQPGSSFALEIVQRRGGPVAPGDMLQIDFVDGHHRAYVALAQNDLLPAGHFLRVIAQPRRTYWFRRVGAELPPHVLGTVHTVGRELERRVAATLDVATLVLWATTPGERLSQLLEAQVGDWLRLETTHGLLWLLVETVRADGYGISAAWVEGDAATVGLQSVARVQRVQIALHVRDRTGNHQVLAGLAFAAPHPRFVGYLPDDARLFARAVGEQERTDHAAAALWREIQHPRFPLAMVGSEQIDLIPLGLEQVRTWKGATPLAAAPLVRDGLVPPAANPELVTDADWALFMEQLFLDRGLAHTSQHALLGAANDLVYLQGRQLQGIHALLPIDEISMVALPDAAQRGWVPLQTQPQVSMPDVVVGVDSCVREGPFLTHIPAPSEMETTGQAVAGEVLLDVDQQTQWELRPSLSYDAGGLLRVQTAVARLAAARADRVAVLGTPKHYRAADALEHQRQLAAALRAAGTTTGSYVALYYPWVMGRDTDGLLVHAEPTGVACGVMAARTLALGAWAAPANMTLREVLALVPSPQPGDDTALYAVSVNMVRRNAGEFTLWGAFTQSPEQELEELNVRRLLILLRRIALREGQAYVFAPHSPGFQHRVKQQFEQILARLYTQGAFAGRIPSEAYRIDIDAAVNTSTSIEQGRLIVELRVAPARPLAFITVRLVQAENEFLAVQEVTEHGR
ncbi:MAG: hypothetical protein WDZ49_12360 [Litorilinea sp.]